MKSQTQVPIPRLLVVGSEIFARCENLELITFDPGSAVAEI